MIDRSLFLIGWIFIAWLALQTLPVSRIVFAPEAVEITGTQVTVARHFPLDLWTDWRPRMSYIETVKPLTQDHNHGQACEATGGPRPYTRQDVVGRWSIEWAADCLSDPAGFTWSATWTWHLGGLSLGPVSLSRQFLRDPCQYRVSSSGVIHGPDSPHWSQTSTERCFPTRAAAEDALD